MELIKLKVSATLKNSLLKKSESSRITYLIYLLNTDFDVVKQSFKEQLKPIKKEIKTTLTYLRDKARSVTEDCYVVYNYDNNSTEFYNGEGEMVYSRPMETSELQKTIFSIDKTGTTD